MPPADSALAHLEALALAAGHGAQDARGRCLSATAALAREARRLGLDDRVAFVRWRVRDDPAFLDHWALALEDDRILDTTAAQVDGNRRPMRRLAEYPPNYVKPRRYPLASVLDVLDAAGPCGSPPPAGRLQWSLQRRLFRHELALAARARSPAIAAGACAELGGTALRLCAGWLLERALRRAEHLLQRRPRR